MSNQPVTIAQNLRPTQQKLIGIDIVKLKGLKDVSLDFSVNSLTAVMGSNCCGKTTLLHALACSYKPLGGGPNYKFPLFFRPNTDALWNDSDFTVRYSERIGATEHPNLAQNYKKASDRWTPKYDRRPERYTRFISIGESVPDIETLNLASMIHYTRIENLNSSAQLVRDAAGQILNKVYDSLYDVKYAYSGRKSIGVKTPTETYSGLSMSSGEQRVFRILDAVYSAPNYGLILIDEIDLFLHQDALQRLLGNLQKHCEAKNKQLIFTTHFPPVAEMYDKMCIYTLNSTPNKTVVWRGYSYEAMRHITGTQERPITCYVEDDVAEQIVARVASQLDIRRFVNFAKYGPAINAFSLCAGLYLSVQDTDHTIAILDGDVFGRRSERRARVQDVITGDMPIHDQQRKDLMSLVRTLTPIKNSFGKLLSPEQMLHMMLHTLSPNQIPADRAELYRLAVSVVNVPEKHGFVNQIIDHTGESREVALSKIIELASTSRHWSRYTRVIRFFLVKMKSELNL